jgi:hypothetical protein
LSGTDFDGATGNTAGAAFMFNDVGRFTVDVNDTNWASVSGDVSNGDCLTTPANFTAANTLSGGKYGCFVMLNPQNGIDLRFIPYQFNITNATLTNASGGTPGFTYFSRDLNTQAATIPMTITAVNETNGTTLNYASGLYEQPITINPNFTSIPSGYNVDINSTTTHFLNGAEVLTGSNALKFNFIRESSTPLAPLEIKGDDNTTKISVVDSDGVRGDINATEKVNFLYGKISAPNAMVDYASTATMRAYAEVYATDPATLPGGASGWIQAPGSSVWWINKLHDGSSGSITNAVIKKSTVLDSTTSVTGFGFSANPPFGINGGVAPMGITMTADQNKDQKILLHLDVPQYLWYGSNAYNFTNFGTANDCTTHPCMSVDIIGTTSSLATPDKAIKNIQKVKRFQKINW